MNKPYCIRACLDLQVSVVGMKDETGTPTLAEASEEASACGVPIIGCTLHTQVIACLLVCMRQPAFCSPFQFQTVA